MQGSFAEGGQIAEQTAPVVSGHTPTPWRVDPRRSLRVFAGDDDTVASVGCQPSLSDQWIANAAFIVRAVNSHEALVKALQEIRDLSKPGQTVSVSQAIDLLCDIWNASDAALASAREVQS